MDAFTAIFTPFVASTNESPAASSAKGETKEWTPGMPTSTCAETSLHFCEFSRGTHFASGVLAGPWVEYM
ncbi:hypothetical protein [Phaffia rhodozyma]|uniref:Uncharacterized protein n=1 Tax=Phaffia rhodozyma TaxID=264483 RepID=A0A0F7SYP0_PHARH|nr:hypothetical protein [Phaffia rhodozyma]